MSQKMVITALAAIVAGGMLSVPAQAGYVCKGMNQGDIADVFGYLQPQSSTSYVLEKAGGGYFIQVKGLSEGEEVDSFLYINEELRLELQRCSFSRQVLFRVECKERLEPEVIEAVC